MYDTVILYSVFGQIIGKTTFGKVKVVHQTSYWAE